MAALDFPASPTNGQIYSGTNGATYQWDGTLWMPGGSAAGNVAGGDLTGSYPSPQIAAGAIAKADIGVGQVIRNWWQIITPANYAGPVAATWTVLATVNITTVGGQTISLIDPGWEWLALGSAVFYSGLQANGGWITVREHKPSAVTGRTPLPPLVALWGPSAGTYRMDIMLYCASGTSVVTNANPGGSWIVELC